MERCLLLIIVLYLETVFGQTPMRDAIARALERATTVVSAGNAASNDAFVASRAPFASPALAATGAPSAASPALVQLQRFNRELPRTRTQRQPTELRLETLRQLTLAPAAPADAQAAFAAGTPGMAASTPQLSLNTVLTDPAWIAAWRAQLGCPVQSSIICDPTTPFRTADGSCNNLLRPELGMSFTTYSRYLQADYDDGIGSPRIRSVLGTEDLPSARSVSIAVLRNPGSTIFDNRNTMMTMAWGQFLDHDTVSTPAQKELDGSAIVCCGPPRPECFEINIVQPDPRFTTTCMNFVRSSPALSNPCNPGVREQINQLTHWIDASNVYGSTLDAANFLRAPGGRLRTRAGNLPPEDPDPNACEPTEVSDYCPIGGDHRISEVVFLGANHVTWLRLHNYIRDELASFGNVGWNGERLYQETRKIIGALQQHITYDEYLPVILNINYRIAFCLTRFCQFYSPSINGAIKNSFGAAAFRMGHSQIPNSVGYMPPSHVFPQRFQLRNHFNKPNMYIRDAGTRIDDMQRYATGTGAARADRLLGREVTDHLFEDAMGVAFDLAALNIQRGRDHGLPPYVRFREFCGLSRVYFFTAGPGGLASHTLQAVNRLRSVYSHQDDIDLYAGALSETPVFGGRLGPTFSCLIALQLRDLKIGERFFWERPDPVTGFTFAQRNAIRRSRLSTVLCLTSNMQVVQRNVFVRPRPGNSLRPCWAIPPLDLSPWNESRSGSRRRGRRPGSPLGRSGSRIRGFPTQGSRIRGFPTQGSRIRGFPMPRGTKTY